MDADAGKTAFRMLDDALAEGVKHSASKADEAGELIEAVVEQCLRNSFSADTLVSTASALRPISQIAMGDQVLAYNQETGETGAYTVTAVMVRWTRSRSTSPSRTRRSIPRRSTRSTC